jgi:hypothetical protein
MTASSTTNINSTELNIPVNNGTRITINASISRNNSNRNLVAPSQQPIEMNNPSTYSNGQPNVAVNSNRSQEIEKLKMQIFEEEQLK